MSILLNGTSQYILSSVNNSLFGTITTAVTVMGWINLTSTVGTQSILSKFEISPNYSFAVGTYNGNPTCQFTTNTTNASIISTAVAVAGTWFHLAATWDSTSQTAITYSNGIVDSSAALAGTSIAQTAGTELCLGAVMQTATNTTPGYFTIGQIEDMRVYNRSLSASEILTISNTMGRDNTVTNLIARFLLTEGATGDVATTTTIADSSMNKLGIATVAGSPTYGVSATSYVRTAFSTA